jgi:hypothetical protein
MKSTKDICKSKDGASLMIIRYILRTDKEQKYYTCPTLLCNVTMVNAKIKILTGKAGK